MKFLRTDLPIYLGVFGGIVVLADMFFKNAILQNVSKNLLEYRVLLMAVALALGAGNLLRIHFNNIRLRRGKAWQYSYFTIGALVGLIVMGIFLRPNHPTYVFLYDSFNVPLQASVFAMNAFWIASACYRSFSMRSSQAAVLLISGIIVMLGKVGIGAIMMKSLPVWADWIMNVPNSAAMRGVNMGAALGMIGVSLRVILGVERGHLGGE